MVDLITTFFAWMPVVPRVLLAIVVTFLIISVLVNLIIKVMDMIPFV